MKTDREIINEFVEKYKLNFLSFDKDGLVKLIGQVRADAILSVSQSSPPPLKSRAQLAAEKAIGDHGGLFWPDGAEFRSVNRNETSEWNAPKGRIWLKHWLDRFAAQAVREERERIKRGIYRLAFSQTAQDALIKVVDEVK